MGENDRELDHAALGAAEMTSLVMRPRGSWGGRRSGDAAFFRYQRYAKAEIAAGRQPLSLHKWLEKFSEEHQTP